MGGGGPPRQTDPPGAQPPSSLSRFVTTRPRTLSGRGRQWAALSGRGARGTGPRSGLARDAPLWGAAVGGCLTAAPQLGPSAAPSPSLCCSLRSLFEKRCRDLRAMSPPLPGDRERSRGLQARQSPARPSSTLHLEVNVGSPKA